MLIHVMSRIKLLGVGMLAQPKYWISVWRRPRVTYRCWRDYLPTKTIIIIAILFGVLAILSDMNDLRELEEDSWYATLPQSALIWIPIVLGPITGVGWLYAMAGLLSITGRIFGSKVSAKRLRDAIALGMIPWLYSLIFTLPLSYLVEPMKFKLNGDASAIPQNLDLIKLGFFLGVFPLFFGLLFIWPAVVNVKLLSQAQRLNWLPASISAILALTIFVALSIMFAFPIAALLGVSIQSLM